MHTEPTGQADSPSLYAELPLTDSETESDEEVPVINAGDQDEGQARPNLGEQDKGQARPNLGSDDEISPPPPQTPTQQAPHTVSTIKLPILKKGEYDIWAMKMDHYLSYTDYPIWEVIQKGNGPVGVSTDTNGVIKVLPPKTAEEILAGKEKEK
ncbi:hypothetical protein Tco_0738136 [Tanacetum coccineum]